MTLGDGGIAVGTNRQRDASGSEESSADSSDSSAPRADETTSCVIGSTCTTSDAGANPTASEEQEVPDETEPSTERDAGEVIDPTPPNVEDPVVEAGDPTPTGGDECVGAVGEWVELPPPDESWAETAALPPQAIVSGTVGSSLYVWDLVGQQLFQLDVCQLLWTELEIDWPSPPSGSASWDGAGFRADGVRHDPVTRKTSPDEHTTVFHSILDFVELGTAEETLLLASSASQAPVPRYEFWFGGAILDAESAERTGLPVGTLGGLGLLFDSADNSVLRANIEGAPSPRAQVSVSAVGDRFLVWGGFDEVTEAGPNPDSALFDGGIYDIATDSWTSVSAVGAPEQPVPQSISAYSSVIARALSTEVLFLNTAPGALYNTATDTWRAVEGMDGFWLGTNALSGYETPNGNWVTAPFDAPMKRVGVQAGTAQVLDIDSVPPPFQDLTGPQRVNGSWRVNTWANGALVRMDVRPPAECSEQEEPNTCGLAAQWRLGGGILRLE